MIETYKTKLGADHPDTLTSMNNLAFIWKGQGQDEQAFKLIEECIALQTRILGTNHPDTLSSCAILREWRTGELEDKAPVDQSLNL